MSINVAVIGVGAMGRNHARVYSGMPDAQLVGVADTDLHIAESVSRRYGGCPYDNYEKLLDEQRPNAVSVAVPTINHYEVAKSVIQRGIHLVIEKPIAASLEEGREIIDAAETAEIKLMIGHIERFNPAVIALKMHLSKEELGRVFQIHAQRQGPFPTRIQNVGVVIDLAVHDLDVMRYISGSEIVRVYAETERRIHSRYEDLLDGLVRLDDGTVGVLTINWLTPTKIRELSVTGERGMFRVNYITQDLFFYENAMADGGEWETLQVLRGVSEGKMIRHVIAKKEPLRLELEAFLSAVRGEIQIPVTAHDGIRALELAQALIISGQEQRVVECLPC